MPSFIATQVCLSHNIMVLVFPDLAVIGVEGWEGDSSGSDLPLGMNQIRL